MRLKAATAMTLALVLAGLVCATAQPQRSRPNEPYNHRASPISESLESVRVRAFLSPSRSNVGHPVVVDILIENTHQTATISPVSVDLLQFSVRDEDKALLNNLSLQPRSRVSKTVRIVPTEPGPFDLLVQISTPTDAIREPTARLEVTDSPDFWKAYGPTLIPLAVAILTALVTIAIQLYNILATKKQRASDSVIKIVTDQGRDYYFAASGALKEFLRALEQLRTATPPEREHLCRRAFFFFGIFLYKENEFSFRHGFLYLGNLWSEGGIRRILRSCQRTNAPNYARERTGWMV